MFVINDNTCSTLLKNCCKKHNNCLLGLDGPKPLKFLSSRITFIAVCTKIRAPNIPCVFFMHHDNVLQHVLMYEWCKASSANMSLLRFSEVNVQRRQYHRCCQKQIWRRDYMSSRSGLVDDHEDEVAALCDLRPQGRGRHQRELQERGP